LQTIQTCEKDGHPELKRKQRNTKGNILRVYKESEVFSLINKKEVFNLFKIPIV